MNEGMETGAAIQQAWESIDQARAALMGKAQAAVDRFWDFHAVENNKRDIRDKSIMGARVRKSRGAKHTFSIVWYKNNWVLDKKGKWLIFSEHIRKGRTGCAYPERALFRHARDWEKDVLLELEHEFTGIRYEMRELNKTAMALERILKRYGLSPVEPEAGGEDASQPDAL